MRQAQNLELSVPLNTAPHLFSEPFRGLAGSLMLDGKIAAPVDNGVTHFDRLTETMRQRRAERLTYFAFDLLHPDSTTCGPARSRTPKR